MKEKLIDILECIGIYDVTANSEMIADHLIANGVTVREKGEWKWEERNRSFWWRCSVCGCTPNDPSDFCPACGADMRGTE